MISANSHQFGGGRVFVPALGGSERKRDVVVVLVRLK